MQQLLQTHFQVKKNHSPAFDKPISNCKRTTADTPDAHYSLMSTLQVAFHLPKRPTSVSDAKNISHSIKEGKPVPQKPTKNEVHQESPLSPFRINVTTPCDKEKEAKIPIDVQGIVNSIRQKKEAMIMERKGIDVKYTPQTQKIVNEISQEDEYSKENISSPYNKARIPIQEIPSQALKYSELISKNESRELMLPWHYKLTLEMMSHLDSTISYLRSAKLKLSFEEIRKNIYSMYKKKFTHKIFTQILSIVPELYTYRWENNLYQEGNLIIDMPQLIGQALFKITNISSMLQISNLSSIGFIPTNILDLRLCAMKEKLVNATLIFHERYLRENRIEIDFDPLKEKTWHHGFKVHSIPPLSEFALSHANSISEYINDVDDPIIRLSLEKATKTVHPNEPASVAKEANNTLGKDLLMLIRKKEKELIEQKNRPIEENITLKVANSLKSIYDIRNVGCLELEEVIKKLDNIDSVEKVITEVVTKCPSWASIVQINGKRYLKLAKPREADALSALSRIY